MKQAALTILAPLGPTPLDAKREQLVALRNRLDGLRGEPDRASDIIDEQLRALLAAAPGQHSGVHYLSFFLLEGIAPARVVLEVNCDGSAASMMQRLARHAPDVLREIFGGCSDFPQPASERGLRRFLSERSQRANAFYVAFPGHSVQQIRGEQELRERARTALARVTPARGQARRCPMAHPPAPAFRRSPTSASDIWRRLREQKTNQDRSLEDDPLVRTRQPAPFWVRWSLSGGRWHQQLELLGRRLSAFLYVLCAAAATRLLYEGGAVQWAGRFRRFAFALEAGAPALAAVWVTLILIGMLAQGPRSLSWLGQWLVVRGAIRESIAAIAKVAVLFSVGALCIAAAAQLSTLAIVLSLLIALGVGGALLLARLGWLVGSGALLALLAAGLLPTDELVLIPTALLAVGWLGFLALVAVVLYIMLGRAAALLGPLALTGAYAGYLLWTAPSLPGPAAGLLGTAAAAFLVLLAAFLGGAAAWIGFSFWMIRQSEIESAQREPHADEPGRVRWDLARLQQVQQREDLGLQNQLITLSPLRPGRTSRVTLERVLRAVQFSALFQSNIGDLGGIRTIHFARFLILRERAAGPRQNATASLLFIGNYDSGFGSYLHEFNAVSFVTAVWSNCVGFPQAYFLLGGGAADEQRFKAFGRNNQVPSIGWYSAYPSLSIGDIDAAQCTRESLQRPLEDPSTWLGRLRSQWGVTLSEADCDLSLRRL